ncbi:IS1 family transposase [bacterium]|nr:MAG: IS1 family transposase [bacterium]
MNKLSVPQRTRVISALVEGNSIRSTSRMTGVAKGTILKLLVELGSVCQQYQDRNLRHLSCKRIECDEIWSFCYAKEKNVPEDKRCKLGYGDVWTFVALEADTKLVLSWHIGWREPEDAYEFAVDIKSRLSNRIQLTTDGHKMYFYAVDAAFGSDIDYAMLIKYYGNTYDENGRYSPPKCTKAKPRRIKGNPNMSQVSTSYIERQNLTMRMGMRRFTRLTNGFSKKIDNLKHSLALHYMFYNFARPHKILANPYPRTPAMAPGITNHVWDLEEIVALMDSK